MRQGPSEFFSVDPKSGKVKTIKGLDYETESQHTLIIGTEENNSTKPGATTKVIIHVEVSKTIWEVLWPSQEQCV